MRTITELQIQLKKANHDIMTSDYGTAKRALAIRARDEAQEGISKLTTAKNDKK
jgi:hypothetical protein